MIDQVDQHELRWLYTSKPPKRYYTQLTQSDFTSILNSGDIEHDPVLLKSMPIEPRWRGGIWLDYAELRGSVRTEHMSCDGEGEQRKGKTREEEEHP